MKIKLIIYLISVGTCKNARLFLSLYTFYINILCDLQEFLAVELRNGRVRFSWNAGGGVGFVEDTTVIQSETSIGKETDKWYKVIAQRSVVFCYFQSLREMIRN